MKVVVLTTSYPRGRTTSPESSSGTRWSTCVSAGVEVEVVSPASFRHFGLAYGHGVVGNLRAASVEGAALPLFLALVRAGCRRAARDADLVHAHWLPSALPASSRGSRSWCSLGIRRRARARARGRAAAPRSARLVLCPSRLSRRGRARSARARSAWCRAGSRSRRVGEPDEPPHVLFVGRLSEEKGIAEFLVATQDCRA